MKVYLVRSINGSILGITSTYELGIKMLNDTYGGVINYEAFIDEYELDVYYPNPVK